MQATVILPVVSLIALFLKSVFGIELGEEVQQQIADAILTTSLAVVSLVGIFKTYKKKDKQPKE